jgi:hypothetical protein
MTEPGPICAAGGLPLPEKPIEDAAFAWPCLIQRGTRHLPGCVAQDEHDDEDVVEWTNHGQKLWNQVDRREEPKAGYDHRHLRPARDAGIMAQPPHGGRAVRQEAGEVLEQSWWKTPRQEYEQCPGGHDKAKGKTDQYEPRHRALMLLDAERGGAARGCRRPGPRDALGMTPSGTSCVVRFRDAGPSA